MKILKFGQSTLLNASSLEKVIEAIVKTGKQEKIAVVVSSLNKISSRLYQISQLAMIGDDHYKTMLAAIEEEHFDIVKHFIDVKRQAKVIASLKVMINDLEDILYGVFLLWELSPRTLDHVMTYGVKMAAYLISECIKDKGIDAEYLDAQKIIITDDNYGNADVDIESSSNLIKKWFSEHDQMQIVTGYIGSTPKGESSTLGKSGAMLTTSLLSSALEAETIIIYADRDGISNTDGELVSNAFSLPSITYAEAMEMSHFGTKIFYPPSLQPAFNKNIPILIKNLFNKDFEGTLITKNSASDVLAIKANSSIKHISLVNIQGSGMIGVKGVAARVFTTLANNNINVILITQASSEHSITLALDPEQGLRGCEVLKNEFDFEIKQHKLDDITLEEHMSIIAVIGEKMKDTPGVSGKIFKALGDQNINVAVIAQGSSELNISIVVEQKDLKKSLSVLHETFFSNSDK